MILKIFISILLSCMVNAQTSSYLDSIPFCDEITTSITTSTTTSTTTITELFLINKITIEGIYSSVQSTRQLDPLEAFKNALLESIPRNPNALTSNRTVVFTPLPASGGQKYLIEIFETYRLGVNDTLSPEIILENFKDPLVYSKLKVAATTAGLDLQSGFENVLTQQNVGNKTITCDYETIENASCKISDNMSSSAPFTITGRPIPTTEQTLNITTKPISSSSLVIPSLTYGLFSLFISFYFGQNLMNI